MQWCLLVFANSPGWCMMTGWMITQGSYFKCWSCYLFAHQSKQEKKETPYYGNLKPNSPQYTPGANCPAKGWKMQPWEVGSWSHRRGNIRKYSPNLWICDTFISWVSPHFHTGGWLCPKLVLYGFFCHHSLKAQASCTHQVYLPQKCVSFGWHRALAALRVSSAQLSTPSLG